ncbi:DsrE family protein [Virgibacillus sp. W0430]|uniref:DsrE family protein n=1 Tax=Virgibacillus sp. W0430 TaxID=3391580 RepID=UPI003F462DF0
MKTDLLITLTAHERDENNVTIAFTMGAKALEKGHQVEILLLSDAVHIAEKGYADKIDIGAPFKSIKDLLPVYLEQGGRLKVCSACMEHNNVAKEDLVEGADVITADYVIDAIMGAERTLQLN